jgi:hypothetical protein
MKHIKTFESYVGSLNEAESFKEGDFVKWTTPQTGNQISFGVVTKVRGKSFDAMVIATGGKGDEQPDRGLAIGLGGPVIWKPGATASQLRKDIEDAGGSSNGATNIRYEKASLWNINENFLNEAAFPGIKAKKFAAMVDDLTDTFVNAQAKEKEEGGELPPEYLAAIKTLGISSNEAMVCFSAEVGDWNKILDSAKKAGLKYIEVQDSETGDGAIVYSAKQ